MRRAALLISSILLLALPSSLAVAGGKPTREPFNNQPLTFDAGLACEFPVHQEFPVDQEVIKTFPPDENGDVRAIVTGRLVATYTNLDTGKSITVNISGPGEFTFHPDGSITVIARGRSSNIFFPTDIPAGPIFFISSGRVVFQITPEGQFILVQQSGSMFDVCAALS